MTRVPSSASIKSTQSAAGSVHVAFFLALFLHPRINTFRFPLLLLQTTSCESSLPCLQKTTPPYLNLLIHTSTQNSTTCPWTLPVPLWLSADLPSSSHWHLLLLLPTHNPTDDPQSPRANPDPDGPPSAPQPAFESSSSAPSTTASTLARIRTTSTTSPPLQRWLPHPSSRSPRPPLPPILRCPPAALLKSPRGDAPRPA